MRRLRGTGTIGALCALALITAPAAAAPLEFSGTLQARAGYATNPFLRQDESEGSASYGGRAAGQLISRASTSTTVLGASYERDGYSNEYSDSDAFAVDLSRQQQFSTYLSGSGQIAYSNSRSAFSDPLNEFNEPIDTETLGARRESYTASGGLQWTGERNVLSANAFAAASRYEGASLSDYDSYGGSVGYSRVLNGRTTVGLTVASNFTDSDVYGKSRSIQPGVTVTHQINAYWSFDGNLGVIFERTKIGGFTDRSKSLGFGATLCGTYPRWSLCLDAQRSTSSSGFGGLRTQTSASARFDYRLTERSRLGATASYGVSDSNDRVLPVPKQKFASADLSYDRDISQRVSAGITAGYRWRDFTGAGSDRFGFGSADSFNVRGNLTLKIGRVQ